MNILYLSSLSSPKLLIGFHLSLVFWIYNKNSGVNSILICLRSLHGTQIEYLRFSRF